MLRDGLGGHPGAQGLEVRRLASSCRWLCLCSLARAVLLTLGSLRWLLLCRRLQPQSGLGRLSFELEQVGIAEDGSGRTGPDRALVRVAVSSRCSSSMDWHPDNFGLLEGHCELHLFLSLLAQDLLLLQPTLHPLRRFLALACIEVLRDFAFERLRFLFNAAVEVSRRSIRMKNGRLF